MANQKLSVRISYLLRHNPGKAGLTMDRHGWVPVQQLLQALHIPRQTLEEIVRTDSKGRYRFSEDGSRIKACQGHSLDWVEPELRYGPPPEELYHGTTAQSWELIQAAGHISRMKRHAVHMQADIQKSWQSARRWHRTPVVLKIDAAAMAAAGFRFGVSDNGVWCTESVPVEFVREVIYEEEPCSIPTEQNRL